MANLILTPQAENDIDEIIDNVVEFTGYEQSGIKLHADIFKKLNLLEFMPSIGIVRDDGTRETFVSNYRIVYEIQNEDIFNMIVELILKKKL